MLIEVLATANKAPLLFLLPTATFTTDARLIGVLRDAMPCLQLFKLYFPKNFVFLLKNPNQCVLSNCLLSFCCKSTSL